MILANRTVWAAFELLIASFLWGYGFVAAALALRAVSPLELTFLRFFIAALVGLPFVFSPAARQWFRFHAKLSLIPGVLLLATIVFQTWGLQYTSATKSGFITTLYVIFVPLVEMVWLGRKLSRGLLLCVAGALVGTVAILGLGFQALNFGDLLTLVCAGLATGHILWLGRVSAKVRAPFAFNIYQCILNSLLLLPFIASEEFGSRLIDFANWPAMASFGVLSLALGPTVVAFYLQIRAQAKLSATLSSLIFLLESPFAMGLAWLLLDETLAWREGFGAALIFVSALGATWVEMRSAPRVELKASV